MTMDIPLSSMIRLVMVGDTLVIIGSDTTGKSVEYWKGGIKYLNRIELNGRRVAFIPPAGREGGQSSMRSTPNGVWILKRK